MAKGHQDKEVAKLIRAMERAGWRVTTTRQGHYRAFHPDGVTSVTFVGKQAGRRSWQNTIAQLKRAGFDYRDR